MSDESHERRRALRSIDPTKIAKHFDAPETERRWEQEWRRLGVYNYDPSRPREETFVVDTPPPTVSGELHVGHVFSYTHTDVVVRYKRMRGFNIFYPMGWDDNGLPTERRVQNYYHVRCDPETPHEPDLQLEAATAKQRKGPARRVSRANFIDLCHGLTEVDERAFMELWNRVGISVDWSQEYATIDDRSRRLAQLSFRDLYEKGHLYISYAPTMWDVDFQTAVAQAEVEDKLVSGAFHDIEFGVEGSDRGFVISTTRPELLPACVGVTAHPEDDRYRHLFGGRAVTPLFHVPVPIFPSELADPEKGTGILMVCTFGDQTDVLWWREQNLALRQLLGREGRLVEVHFDADGSQGFESLRPEAANACYQQLQGKGVKQAQQAIVELLRDPDGSATGRGAPLQGEPQPIEHPVKFYEKGDRPLELLPTRQWFARLLDKKEEMLAKGREVQWHPSFMYARYRDWTEKLGLDWCLSRQRFFGVPIPVWYPVGEGGEPDYDHPIVAEADDMPLDPMSDVPRGYREDQRGIPGGFAGEADIFDTWFTSSLTPQIGSHWLLDPERHRKLFPADIRPQSHEIIRTWAFYTIAKALLHEDTIPWKHVLVSGWILDPDRKKMSKSRGNAMTPMAFLDQYTADGVRYWAASARLGTDTAFDEKVFKVGKRLVTKLFNAGKFVLSQTGEVRAVTAELDRGFVARLRSLVEQATKDFDAYNFAHVLMQAESFFWTHFTDTFLELAKPRARHYVDGACHTEEEVAASGSAVAALRLGLDVLLRLFAPMLPFITEEVWSWVFAEETGHQSIHAAPWPGDEDFAGIEGPANPASFDLAVAALAAINKCKADAEVSMGREVESLVLCANAASLEAVRPVLDDVLGAARCHGYEMRERSELEAGAFEAVDARFAPKPEKTPKS
jgi:valyl-tRNA synthetase